jgi:hypothetical protein
MHLPAVQADGVDVAVSHAFEQPPQLVTVVIGVSHPFLSTPAVSQLP